MHKMTLKKIKNTTVKFLEELWLPLALIIVAIFLGIKFLPKEDAPRIVIGVALGVFIGFVVEILTRNYTDFRNKIKLEKAALELLKADAITIYKCFYSYEILLKDDLPDAALPPELGLKNWNLLKQNVDFLLLSTAPPLKNMRKCPLWKI